MKRWKPMSIMNGSCWQGLSDGERLQLDQALRVLMRLLETG